MCECDVHARDAPCTVILGEHKIGRPFLHAPPRKIANYKNKTKRLTPESGARTSTSALAVAATKRETECNIIYVRCVEFYVNEKWSRATSCRQCLQSTLVNFYMTWKKGEYFHNNAAKGTSNQKNAWIWINVSSSEFLIFRWIVNSYLNIQTRKENTRNNECFEDSLLSVSPSKEWKACDFSAVSLSVVVQNTVWDSVHFSVVEKR